MNVFDENFRRVDESLKSARADNYRLIESVLEVGNAQKIQFTRQKALASIEVEINQLRASNKETKKSLMSTLIERDELTTKKAALNTMIERLASQNESLHQEIDDLLGGDEVDSICEKFSFAEQNGILKDLQDTRCKLMKLGFPLNYFA